MIVLRLRGLPRLLPFMFLSGWLWIVACGDSQPGEVDVFLVSPNGPESAAIVELDGVFDRVSAPPSAVAFSEIVDGRTRVAIMMRTHGEVWFSVLVPNVSDPPPGRVLEVAGPTNAIRANVEDYGLQFGR